MSKMTINRSFLKSNTCFLEGSPNEDFLQFLASPAVLGHTFETFRRAAAQKHMVQSTLLRPSLSDGPKGWNSGFDETRDFWTFISISNGGFLEDPQALHFGQKLMNISFKVLVSNLKVHSEPKSSEVKNLFSRRSSSWGFSWISGFPCGLGPQSWSISARSSAKANGAKHSPPSFSLRWPEGMKFSIWRNTRFP